MIKKVWQWLCFRLFEFYDVFYSFTGLRLQTPIEVFFPDHCRWLFDQMMGQKGELVENEDD